MAVYTVRTPCCISLSKVTLTYPTVTSLWLCVPAYAYTKWMLGWRGCCYATTRNLWKLICDPPTLGKFITFSPLLFNVCLKTPIIAWRDKHYLHLGLSYRCAHTHTHTLSNLYNVTSLLPVQEAIVSLEIDKKDIRTRKGQIGRER